jgi:glycosyltransferase involved in cell wall biosynthesis
MKVLWLTNIPTPTASLMMGKPASPYGGWLQGSLGGLGNEERIKLTLASPGSDAVSALGSEAGVEYVAFPAVRRRHAMTRGREVAAEILETQRPDLVHVHGTEMPHALSFAAECAYRDVPAVVSIQGLITFIAQHLTAYLPNSVVYGPSTRPWVRSDRVAGLRRAFQAEARLERETLRLIPHVIGRTTWDFACTGQISPERQYHHCDETLRPSFYQARWHWEDVRPHSILVAQGQHPIKGLHLLLQALPAVLTRFPDTLVRVAGQSPLDRCQRTPYSRYIARLLRDSRLEDHVRFVGPQSETEMLAHYLSSHVLVCPSTIENSSNSVAEAMLLGAPVVAAHVGGIPDMITHATDGFTYQADAPYMLAHLIMTMFGDPEAASVMGTRARERALVRNNPERNARQTAAIYTSILNQGGISR